MLASLLVAVTFISTRLNVLVPGQAVGEIKGLQEAFSHPRLSYTYHATTMEYLVGLFLVGVGMTVYFIGRRISKMFAARAA
jgi:molybdopterin-containing oxidoreductase family membrane subunit